MLRQVGPTGWRIELDAESFNGGAALALNTVGSYIVRDHHLLQVWCVDERVRREALLVRSAGIARLPEVADAADLRERIARLAKALQATEVSLAELRDHVASKGDTGWLSRLDELIGADR